MKAGLAGLWLLLWVGPAAAADLIWQADLEADDGGFTVEGDTGQWSWDQVTTGPEACFSGAICWATLPQGAYLHEATDYLIFPVLDVTSLESPALVFERWIDVSLVDFGTLEAELDGVWTPLEPAYGYPFSGGYSGASAEWKTAYFSLLGLGDSLSLRLRFETVAGGTGAGWYVDDFSLYDGDVAPPSVTDVTELPDTEDVEGPYVVSASVADDVGLTSVWLEFSVDSGTVIQVAMTDGGDGSWSGAIPGQESGHEVTYWVLAEDMENQSVAPEEGWSFRVRLPPPTDLTGPEAIVHGALATLSWAAPESGHVLESYGIYRDGVWVTEVSEETAELSVETGTQNFAVSALYDVGESALSESFELVAAVPELQSVSPATGYQGDRLRLEIVGAYLLMIEGEVSVSPGEGITIASVEVRDVDTLVVTVDIDAEASPGQRDFSVSTAQWEVTLSSAFEVVDGANRPMLSSVSPDQLTQGESVQVIIAATAIFTEIPTVYFGEGVIVESVGMLDDKMLEVAVAVAWDAALGERVVEVDDGVRVLDDVTLWVRDYVVEVPRGRCATAADPGLGGGWLVAFMVGFRRRHSKRSAAAEESFVKARSTPKAVRN